MPTNEALTIDVPAPVFIACNLDDVAGVCYHRHGAAYRVTFSPGRLALFLDDVTTRSNLLGESGFTQDPGWIRSCRAFLPKLVDAATLYLAAQTACPLPRDVETSLRYYLKTATLAVAKRDFNRSVRAGRRSFNA